MGCDTVTRGADLSKYVSAEAMERLLKAKQNPGKRDPHGEYEGVVDNPDELKGIHASLAILAKDIVDILSRKYPGFLWAVQPLRGGITNIWCRNFSSRWGFTINIDDIQNDPNRKIVTEAGGQILRRFGYRKDRYDPQEMAKIKRNSIGEAIPEVSDLPKTRFTTAAKIDKAIAEGRATFGEYNGQTVVGVHE